MSPPVRDAATIIAVRDHADGPRVLMGQRGAQAAFMPSKYVFPGGAVDAQDAHTPLATPLSSDDHAALRDHSTTSPEALATAAVRELLEETGQRATAPQTDTQWAGLQGEAPNAGALRFVFRAITPPGRPRRFDARFFMIKADALRGDLDDFSRAEDELSHLHWVLLSEARALDVPFITEVVLAEIAARLRADGPRLVPFFDNSGATSVFRYLGA
jgi:8-oxo-dGTP pyrophosphatase MutT (NUDIX family)